MTCVIQIYLNGRVCQQPHSPRLSRTRVEGLRHDRPQQLAIQTLAASGQVSSRLELIYQGVGSPPAHSDKGEEGEADTDLSSILNSIHYKTGKKRTVSIQIRCLLAIFLSFFVMV